MENITAPPKPWFREHAQKLVALLFWVLLILGYQWYAYTNHLSALEVAQNLVDFLTKSFWGLLAYFLLYAIRPLILFPSTELTVAGGFVFGLKMQGISPQTIQEQG